MSTRQIGHTLIIPSGIILLMPVLLAAPVQAVTKTWNGSTSTNWTTDANWTPGPAPTPIDDVIIDGNGTYAPTLDLTNGAVTIASLALGANSTSTLTLKYGDMNTRKLIITGHGTIGAKGTLTHVKNGAAETHRLFLDVGGDMTIVSGGTLNVNAMGYVGGGPGYATQPGYGGQGGPYQNTTCGPTYGSIAEPSNLGSGNSINGGGAARLKVAGTLTVNGGIMANGSTYGSGGSLWLAAGTIAGTGPITANGSYGGGGRIALYYTTKSYTGTIAALGNNGSAAGTLYEKPASQTYGNLVCTNALDASVYTYLFNGTNPAATLHFAAITAKGRAHVFIGVNITSDTYAVEGSGTIERWSDANKLGMDPTMWWTGSVDTNWNTAGNWSTGVAPAVTDKVIIEGCATDLSNHLPTLPIPTDSNVQVAALGLANGSTLTLNAPFGETDNRRLIVASNCCLLPIGNLTHSGHASGAAAKNRINAAVGGNMAIFYIASIDVTGKGYLSAGPGYGTPSPSYGGQGYSGAINGPTYGSITQPADLGSGANLNGGGAIKLNVTGTLTHHGAILAKGSTYSAGGSIWIAASTLAGSSLGAISANGNYGGGGRIALYYTAKTYAGSISAYGHNAAAAGTLYEKTSSQTNGTLTVDNNIPSAVYTSLSDRDAVNYTFDNIIVTNYGRLKVGTNDTLALAAGGTFSNEDDNATLTVDAGGIFTNAGTLTLAGTGTALVVAGTFTNVSGSAFRYVGTTGGVAAVTVLSTIPYQTLAIDGPGQTFLWTAGATYTVNENFLVNGTLGHLITLHSTVDGTPWYLKLTGRKGQAQYVSVKDSDASPGYLVRVNPGWEESVNEGYNINWIFGPLSKGTFFSAH